MVIVNGAGENRSQAANPAEAIQYKFPPNSNNQPQEQKQQQQQQMTRKRHPSSRLESSERLSEFIPAPYYGLENLVNHKPQQDCSSSHLRATKKRQCKVYSQSNQNPQYQSHNDPVLYHQTYQQQLQQLQQEENQQQNRPLEKHPAAASEAMPGHGQQSLNPIVMSSNNHQFYQKPPTCAFTGRNHAQQQQQQNLVPQPVTAFTMLTKSRQQNASKTLSLLSPFTPQQHSSSSTTDWLQLQLGINELAGEAGSGKSQIAMSLCVQAVLQQQQWYSSQSNHRQQILPTTTTISSSPALPASSSSANTVKAIYISLSGGQPSLSRIAHRMQQMIETRLFEQRQQLQRQEQQQEQPPSTEALLAQILTHSVRNQDDLLELLRVDLPRRLQEQQQQQQQQQQQEPCFNQTNPIAPNMSLPLTTNPVAVIVLDSIADLFRLGNGDTDPHDNTAIASRSFILFEISALLRTLSDEFQIPILVINQVSGNLTAAAAAAAAAPRNGKSNAIATTTVPTLGLSWMNCVNTSYMVRRQTQIQAHATLASTSTTTTNTTTNKGAEISSKNDSRCSSSSSSSNTFMPAKRGRQLFLTKSSKYAANHRAIFDIEARGVVPKMARG